MIKDAVVGFVGTGGAVGFQVFNRFYNFNRFFCLCLFNINTHYD